MVRFRVRDRGGVRVRLRFRVRVCLGCAVLNGIELCCVELCFEL